MTNNYSANRVNFKMPGGFHDGEVTLAFLRRHWFVMFLNAVMFLVLMILPIGIYALIPEQLLGWIRGFGWSQLSGQA